MRARGLTTALLVLSVATGCGSEEQVPPEPPIPDGTPRQRIAATVNAMFDAWNNGDGEFACAYMTPRGQRFTARIARRLHQLEDDIAPDDCIEAVEGSAAATEETIGQSVTAEAVSIEGKRASVASRFRGALGVRQLGGVWLVDVPTFID